MPKEIVLSADPLHDGEEVEGLVQVGWNVEAEYVQVATFSRAMVTHETIWDGFYVSLNRDGINRLIRNLRRARDQAYGRDE
jgi:hypothetical protein